MNHYLVIYNRREGRILAKESFTDGRVALRRRLAAERQHSDNPDIEVVVLSARSWANLQRTHARYFKSVQDLAASALK